MGHAKACIVAAHLCLKVPLLCAVALAYAWKPGCRRGFWGIFLLAAWPNALFDLCGICCGHFLMPFWEFFGATFCGKALVKVCPIHRLHARV